MRSFVQFLMLSAAGWVAYFISTRWIAMWEEPFGMNGVRFAALSGFGLCLFIAWLHDRRA